MGSTITVVGSGSKGNSYILDSGGEKLIIDIGCKFAEIIGFIDDLKKVVGCICDHAHHDHINPSTAKEFIRRGVDCYAHEEVIEDGALGGFKALLSGFRNEVGGFIIQTFKAPHNVPNYGFLITTPTNERILFLTDTTGVNLRFRDIDCIMVECNHDDDTLLDNLSNHDVSMSHPEWHLGLDDCAEFCKQNLSASTKQIILIHLSHTNVNEEHAIATVKERCHFDNVAVAHKGDTLKIENDDF